MRLLLRLRVGRDRATVDWHDVEVRAPDDVTVGEIAAALHPLSHAAAPGTPSGPVTLQGPDGVLPPDICARRAGPPSGAEVEVVPAPSAPGTDDAPPGAPPSPVVLVGPHGDRIPLVVGANRVDAAEVVVGTGLLVRRPHPGAVAVNGAAVVAPRPLSHGDLLRTASGVRSVVVTGPLHAPPPVGTHRPHHVVPAWTGAPAPPVRPPVELPAPPVPPRRAGLPLLSTAVPLALGVGLWWATRSAMAGVFMLLSAVLLLATTLEGRRDARREHRAATAEFDRALADATAEVVQRVDGRRAHLDALHPPASAWLHHAPDAGPVRWGHVAPLVRVGTGPVPTTDLVVGPGPATGDPQRRLAQVAEAGQQPVLPVVVDLRDVGCLGVTGDPARTEPVLRALVTQLALSCPPSRCALRVDEPRPWTVWLPHTDPDRATVAPDGCTVRIAGPGPVRADGAELVLWHGPAVAAPTGAGAVLHLDPDGVSAVLRRPGRPDQPVTTEPLGARDAVTLARSLAPMVPDDGPATDPGSVTLRTVLGPDPSGADPLRDAGAVRRRWAAAARRGDLGAPVAVVDGSVVHVDVRTDGPHALVAGTTGAGKSELLRTLVVSLALHHGPDRCTFLLVDYKGGAAFAGLSRLPHTVGLVTDLDGPLAARALVSLRAELRHRERAAASGGPPPPALLVVVDEFATLVREVPGFVDGLLDVAQRGRSLGLHLVLATQHPRGVVTDAIRANTALRIALRTVDTEASTDVVDAPDAASIPADRPGRAVLRTAGAPPVVVQTAWTGAAAEDCREVRVRPLIDADAPWPAAAEPGDEGARCADELPGAAVGEDQLDAAVRAIGAAAAGMPPARRPWVDPLPRTVPLHDLPVAHAPGAVTVGLVDRPAEQRVDPLVVDLCSSGGAVVLGAGGSGRSTALRALAAALVAHPVETVHVDVVGARGELADLASCRAVGAVLDHGDDERVLRLLRRLAQVVEQRRRNDIGCAAPVGSDRLPRRVLVVDDLRTLLDRHERHGDTTVVDLLETLATVGPAHGVHLVIGARRSIDVPPGVGTSLGARLQLRPASADDALLVGLPESAADPATPPGRGHLGAAEFHVALAGRPADRPDRAAADGVPALAATARSSDRARPSHPWRVPVGIDVDTFTSVTLDLAHGHAVVAGPGRAGVSTALASIAARAHARSVLVTDRAPADGPWDAVVRPEALTAHPLADGPALLVVDDAHRLLDDRRGPTLDDVLADVMEAGRDVRVVLGGHADHLGRLFGRTWAGVRACRTGLLLRPDPDLHGALVHTVVPRRADVPPAPGRGWLVSPDGPVPVHLWLPPTPR